TITPWRLQAPPPANPSVSQSTVTGPPSAATFLSFLPAKNPRYLPSGDQKGASASSVFSSGSAFSELRGRIQISRLVLGATAENASSLPSGEMAGELK